MELKKRFSFLSYAVNGAGVGHVVRQLAVQRWLRRLCAVCGVKSEHWFLTTSEADALVFREGGAAFKLPSKSIVEDAGVDKLAYIALAKQWVWHSLSTLRPDVLLTDTFAEGSFGELPAALDLVRHTVLVQRPLNERFAQRPGYAALVRSYDRVIVPEHEDDEPDLRAALYGDDDGAHDDGRLRFVGPILRPERRALLPREAARAALGVAPGDRCVLVTGGGGGDDGIDALFDAVAALEHEGVHVVYGAGPLFRGRPRRGARRTFFVDHDLAEHAAAFDVAVTAAGFNTIHELLHFGVPLVVVPQEKIADDQAARAARYEARGALRTATVATVAVAVRALLADDDTRAALAQGATRAVPEGHGRDAALATLELLLPPSVSLALRRWCDDGVVDLVLDRAVGLSPAAEAASVRDVFALAAALAGHDDRAGLTSDDVRRANALVRETGSAPEVLSALCEQLRRKLMVTDAAVALRRLAKAAAGETNGLLEVLRALQPERHVDASKVIDAIEVTAGRLVLRGEGFVQLAARLRAARAPTARAVSHAGSANAARLLSAFDGSSHAGRPV